MPFTKSFSGELIEENAYGIFASVEEASSYVWKVSDGLQRDLFRPEKAISLHFEDRARLMDMLFPQVPVEKRDTFLALYNKREYLFEGFPKVWDDELWETLLLNIPILESYNEWKSIKGEEPPGLYGVEANLRHIHPDPVYSFWKIYASSEDADLRLVPILLATGVSTKNIKSADVRIEIIQFEENNRKNFVFTKNLAILRRLDEADERTKQEIVNNLFKEFTFDSDPVFLKEVVDKTGILVDFSILRNIKNAEYIFNDNGILFNLAQRIVEKDNDVISNYLPQTESPLQKYSDKFLENIKIANKEAKLGLLDVAGLKYIRENKLGNVTMKMMMKNAPLRLRTNSSKSEIFMLPDLVVPQTKIRLNKEDTEFLISFFNNTVAVSALNLYRYFIGYLHPIDGVYFNKLIVELQRKEDEEIILPSVIIPEKTNTKGLKKNFPDLLSSPSFEMLSFQNSDEKRNINFPKNLEKTREFQVAEKEKKIPMLREEHIFVTQEEKRKRAILEQEKIFRQQSGMFSQPPQFQPPQFQPPQFSHPPPFQPPQFQMPQFQPPQFQPPQFQMSRHQMPPFSQAHPYHPRQMQQRVVPKQYFSDQQRSNYN